MRPAKNPASPLGYFSAKHPDKITVQLDGIDDVKAEKQCSDSAQNESYFVERKRRLAACRSWWLGKKAKDRDSEDEVQRKENSHPNNARPKFAPAEVSVPRLF